MVTKVIIQNNKQLYSDVEAVSLELYSCT